MNIIKALKIVITAFLLFGTYVYAFELPFIEGERTVAEVNHEPITLEDLNRAVASAHDGMTEKKTSPIDYSFIMKRLINTRLIVLEAKNIGLDNLPEIKDAVETFSKKLLMELVVENYVKEVTVTENEIDKLYKDAVREYKLKSVVFKNENDARIIREQTVTNGSFDAIVQNAFEQGMVSEIDVSEYMKTNNLALPIAFIVSEMEEGAVSPVLRAGQNAFVVFKIEDIRYPETGNTELRKTVRLKALRDKKASAAKEYYHDLKKQYVKIDTRLLDSLDFESDTPGIATLSKDNRIIAEIKGDDPLTVGDFALELEKKYYHGFKRAVESRRVNNKKYKALDDIVEQRVLMKEAHRKGIDRTKVYKSKVKDYADSMVFGAFIEKTVIPDIRINREELETYYSKNAERYSSPRRIRIKSLVFNKREDAVVAMDKLKKGTDFTWLSMHGEGQSGELTRVPDFFDKLLPETGFPEDVQKTLQGAVEGDFRMHQGSDGHFYVFYISNVVPSSRLSFMDVKDMVTKDVYQNKIKTSVESLADRLRGYYPVKVYFQDNYFQERHLSDGQVK